MNKNDLAALAALGAMGYMYMNRDKGGPGGAGGTGAEPVRGAAADYVDRGGAGAGGMRPNDVVYGGDAGVGTAGQDKRSDMDDFSGFRMPIRPGQNTSGIVGPRGGGGGGSNAAANMNAGMGQRDAGYGYGPSSYNPDLGDTSAGDTGAEDTGISGTNIALGGAGAAAAAAAAYKAKRMAEARANERTNAGIATDDAERRARLEARLDAEEKARLQAQERATMDEEIRRELKKGQNKLGPGTPDRSAVLSRAAHLEGPSTDKKITTLGKTVVRETPAETKARNAGTGRGGQGGASSAEMDEFSKLLRESRVGPKGTTVKEAGKVKASGAAGKAGLALTALGLGSAANAAVDMTPQERKRLALDVAGSFAIPLGATPSMSYAPTIYDQSKSGRPATAAEIAAEKKKREFNFDFSSAAGSKRGGQIKTKKMASGGMTSKASSASKRGDGIASKGKTNCKMY